MRRSPRLHYAWVVLIAASALSAVSGTVALAFGVLVVPVSTAMDWSKGQVSLAYSVQFLSQAVFSLVAGWLSDRLGTRRVLLGGSLLLAAGLVMAGRSQHLWELYLYYGVLAGAARAAHIAPLHATVGLWFRRKLGLAMGLVVASMNLGSFIAAPLLRYSITKIEWGPTLVWAGILGGIVMLLAAWFVRNHPHEMGLKALGDDEPAEKGAARLETAPFYKAVPNFARYALATQPFFLLIAVHFLGCVSHSLPLAHSPAIAEDHGISPMLAAGALGFVSGFAIIGRLGFGVLADLWGGKRALVFTLLLQASGILLLFGSGQTWLLYSFALIFGIGFGGEMVVFPVLNRQYYGSAPVATIYGYQMAGASLGMALGGYLGGMMADMTGNYHGAILLASLAGYLGVIATLRLASPFARAVPAPAGGSPEVTR